LAFLLYLFIVVLINMYATTGRNAPSENTKVIDDSNIEMARTGTEWYSRVPSGNDRMHNYVLGDDDDDDDELAPR
jgi:hypothetical protein